MEPVNNLTVWFNECSGLTSEADVEDIIRLFAEFGLVPVEGGWGSEARLVVDLPAHLTKVHSVSPKFKKPEPGLSSDTWILKLLRVDQPQVQTNLFISRDQLDASWRILMNVYVPSYLQQGQARRTSPNDASCWDGVLGTAPPTSRPSGETGCLGSQIERIHWMTGVLRTRSMMIWRRWCGAMLILTCGFGRTLNWFG